MKKGLRISRIWEDEHLVEFECEVETGAFHGTGTCYAAQDQLPRFVEQCRRFAERLEGLATFDAALSDGTKAVRIDLFAIDRAKHIVVSVKLATDRGLRRDDISKLEVQFPIEAAGLDDFIRELGTVHRRGDRAFLRAAG